MSETKSRDCEHGSLRRSCEICYRDEEIARLRALVAATQEKCAQVADKRAQWERNAYGNTDGALLLDWVASAIRFLK